MTEFEPSVLRQQAVDAVLAEFHRPAGWSAVDRVVSARDRAGLFADAVLAVAAAELERSALAYAQGPLRRVQALADRWARPNSGWVACGEVAGRLYAALDGRRYEPNRDWEDLGDDDASA